MIDIDIEKKQNFKNDTTVGRFLSVTFQDPKTDKKISIDNFDSGSENHIASESLVFTESICSSDFQFGLSEANSLEFQYDYNLGDFTGWKCFAYVYAGIFSTIRLGTFLVQSCEPDDDHLLRRAVCVDDLSNMENDFSQFEIQKKLVSLNHTGKYEGDVFSILSTNIKYLNDGILDKNPYPWKEGEWNESTISVDYTPFNWTAVISVKQVKFDFLSDMNNIYFRVMDYKKKKKAISEFKEYIEQFRPDSTFVNEVITDLSTLFTYCKNSSFDNRFVVSCSDEDLYPYFYPYISYDKNEYNGRADRYKTQMILPYKITLYSNYHLADQPTVELFSYQFDSTPGESDFYPIVYSISLTDHDDGLYNRLWPIISLSLNSDNIESFSFLDLLESYCELCGCFGNINRSGNFVFKKLALEEPLYPATDLYPETDLYPSSGGNNVENINKSEYKRVKIGSSKINYFNRISMTYENENGITKYLSEDLFNSYEDEQRNLLNDHKTYSLGWNFIVQNCFISDVTANSIIDILKNELKKISYISGEIESIALPWVEAGDIVSAKTDDGEFRLLVFRRTMSGIILAMDTFEAN